MKTLANDPLRIVSGDFVAAAATPDSIPAASEVEIAFVGRSNVGKSTLLNTLCLRKSLFRTSSTPGCTRQLVFFSAKTKDGAKITLVDVPGYGYAARSKAERKQWSQLIETYLTERSTLAGVAVLIDVRRGIEQEERDLIELLKGQARTHRPELSLTAIATKIDKTPAHQRMASLKQIQSELGIPTLPFSARLPETHTPAWHQLRRALGLHPEAYAGALE